MALKKPALPEPPNASVLQRIKDLGLDVFAHTPVAMGEALVGLADIPTMGYAGKALQEIGYDPKKTHEIINRGMSEERQYEQAMQSDAYDESILKGLGYSLSNPAPAIGTIIQSIPLMYGGRGIAQQILKRAPAMIPALAGGIGEGAIAGGMTLEQIRQDSPDGTLTPQQYGIGLGAGAVTGALGYAGGRLAGKLGLEDIDVPGMDVKDVIEQQARKSLTRRIGEGIIQEGVFEELPQSVQEQVAQNVATGKEWNEGLNEAAGLGFLTGGVMGGVMQGKQAMKAKMVKALFDRQRVNEEKTKAIKEATDKFQETKASVETSHQEAVVTGKDSKDLLGDSPTLDEQRVDQKLSESQQEAAEAIQSHTDEAEALNEAIDASTVTEAESALAQEIVTMLAPYKEALGAGEEFEANIIFAARQDLSKQEFVDLLTSVYGDKGKLAAKVIYPKLQKLVEDMTYEAQQAVAFHTENANADQEIAKIVEGINKILASETYQTANESTRAAMDQQIERFKARLEELKGMKVGKIGQEEEYPQHMMGEDFVDQGREMSDEEFYGSYAQAEEEPQGPEPYKISDRPEYKVFDEDLPKITSGKKTIISNVKPIESGDYSLRDGTEITLVSSPKAISFKQLEDSGKAEEWARLEGYESVLNAMTDGSSRIKSFIKGKRNLYIARIESMDTTKRDKYKQRSEALRRHAGEATMKARDADRDRALAKEDEAMKWEYFESEGLDQKTLEFLDADNNPIPFTEVKSYESRIEEEQPEGTIYVKVLTKDGKSSPEYLVSRFDFRQHLQEKSRKLPRKNKLDESDRQRIKEALLIRNKVDETDPIVDEETREYLKQERAREIFQEGLIDGVPLGDKSIDAPKNRLDIGSITGLEEGAIPKTRTYFGENAEEEEAMDYRKSLLEDEDVYRDGDAPQQPRTYVGESTELDAESLDFFIKMRRFKNVKRLDDIERVSKDQGHLQKRVDKIVDAMKANPFLRGTESETEKVYGYANYIGEMIKEAAQTFEFTSVIDFIKREEGIMTLAELQEIPQSLEDLLEFAHSGVQPYEPEPEPDNVLTKSDREMFVSRVWDAISRAAYDAEMLDANRKAAAVFVKDPRGVIKFVRDYFDYGSTTVPSTITVKEMAGLSRAFRKEFGAEIDPEIMNVLVQASKDKRLTEYLKSGEAKMRQFKGDHDVSKLYPYTPETPKVRPVERQKAEETKAKLKKSAYEAFKDITTNVTQGTIDVGVATGFFRALNKLANVGHSTSARLFDPAKIVGIMKNDPEVPKSFKVVKETKLANGKIVKQEVPFDTQKKIVQELWRRSRIEYGTWTKRHVKEEAVGDLTAENIDVIRSEGAMHIQDIDKEIRLRDETFEYQSFAETKNLTGYRVWTATVVESVTYTSPSTGKLMTLTEPTPKQMELIKQRDPAYQVKTKDIPYMKPKEIDALKKKRVVTQSDKSIAVGDAKVYQVKLNDGDPVNMNMVEIVRNRRKGDTVQILGDAATYSVRVYNTKEKTWTNKRLRKDQLDYLKNKILEAHAKKINVPVKEMTKAQVSQGLDPYLRHIEYRGQQQIFPWDQTTLLTPLYDLALGQSIISMEDIGRQVTNISFLKQVNVEITAAKEAENEEALEELYSLKNRVSEQIAAFNISVKAKLAVNKFHASMVVDPLYFERLAEAAGIDKMGGEQLFELFMRSGMDIEALRSQVSHMKLQQEMDVTAELIEKESKKDYINSYVKARLPVSDHALYDKVLKDRTYITKVSETDVARRIVVATQVFDVLNSSIENGRKLFSVDVKITNKIADEAWEGFEKAMSQSANWMNTSGQEVPPEMIFTNRDNNLRDKKKLDAFEQELVEQNPSLTVGRLFSKKAQIFYKAVAKAFGADLVIVHDLHYTSRYISKASDGRAKIIININSPTSFSRIYGHELFHHVVAKSAPEEYKAFKKAVIEQVTNPPKDGRGNNYGQWVQAVELMMKQRGIQYPKDAENMPFENLVKYLAEKHISEEEIMAEIFASMVHDKGFYEALATSFAGRGLAAKMITHLIQKVEEVNQIALRENIGYSYEANLLMDQDQMKEMHRLFADFVGVAVLSKAVPEASFQRMHTSWGRQTLENMQEFAGSRPKWFKGVWEKIFPEGTKSRKEVMDQLEVHINNSVQWIKDKKPKVMWADWMADRMALKYMNIIAHGQAKQVGKIRYRTKKHKAAWNGMNDEDKKAMHDLFVRGLHTRYEYVDDNGETKTVFKKSEIPYARMSKTIVTKVGYADITTEEGRERYRKFGYTDAQIDAMTEYKQIADEIWETLSKLFPELEKNEFHYGQTIKWYRKDGREYDVGYDWEKGNYSKLEGRKEFLGDKNFEMTTDQIAEANNLEYLHVDPDRMILDYVHDAYKLIYFKQALGQALKTGEAKVFYKQSIAQEQGYYPASDSALRIIQNQAMSHGVKILVGDPKKNEYYQNEETGQDAIYETEEEARRVIRSLKVENAGQRYSTIRFSYDRNTVVVGYHIVMKKPNGEIKKLPKEYRFDGSEYDKAVDALIEIREKQNDWLNEQFEKDPNTNVNAGHLPTFHIETEEKAGEGDLVAKVYFKEDMANMLNNLLAEDLIRNRAFFGITGRKIMDVKNQYTSIEFAISLFHAMTIGQELIASTAAWTYGRLRQDNQLTFREAVKGYNPVTAMRESREIAALMEAVLGDTTLAQDPAIKKKAQELFKTENADVLDAIIQFYDAGGLTGMDRSLRSHVHYQGEMRYKDGDAEVKVVNGKVEINLPKGDRIPAWVPGPFTYGPFSTKAILNSFKEVWEQQIKENPDHKLTAAFKTGKFAIMEGTTAWLMEQGIPRIKMAMWAREYTLELDRQKEAIEAGETNKEFIARNTMKFVEDRFGEVNWMNTWMNPTYKTALQMAFRSFTWFTGSWNALAKAGIDVGKLGWFKMKGEEYELTSRGLWAMNAIVAHMMAVGLIYTMFTIGSVLGGGATEDDDEVPLLTRFLFPRVDPLDPEKRVAVPSYVTEWYKLFRHLGIIGTHMEPSKLISGRFNSLIGKTIDLANNSDFRGVAITNDADGLIGKTVDRLLYMAPLPISISAARKNWETKGFDPVDFMLSGMGFVDAPAAAKRSAAANKAFEIRRREYKGREISADEMALKDKVKRAAYAYGEGDKKPLMEMLKKQEISKKQFDNALQRIPLIKGKKNPRYVDPLSAAMKGLTIEGALEVWNYMSDAEKKSHRMMILKKYQNMQQRAYRSGEYKKEIRDKMKELKILK